MNRSKSILILAIFFSLFSIADDIPRMISYQGVLTDAIGNNVANGSYNLTFHLYDTPTGGTPLWSEGKPVTVLNGVFETMLGDVAELDLYFGEQYWLGIVVSGGTELLPRMALAASPYSIIAESVSDSSIVTSNLVDGAVTQEKLAPGLSLPPGGTAGGDLSGSYPNPTVTGLNGTALSASTPSNGQVLKFDGSNWAPAADDAGTPIWSTNGSTAFITNRYAAVGIETSTSWLGVRSSAGVYSSTGDLKVRLEASNDNIGRVLTYGTNGTNNIRLSWLSGQEDHGFLGLFNASDELRYYTYTHSEDFGTMAAKGPNDSFNAVIGTLFSNRNHGFVGVYDAASGEQAGIYVNSSGQGVVYGDIKNFRTQSPTNPNEEIWYASLEGPEAGAYVRGTATLRDGSASVALPEHFQSIATKEGMTVMLTPLDASSEGMAVVSKTAGGFEVRELRNGKGNYEFDWEVKAVRKGFEDYQVVRPKMQMMSKSDLEAKPGDK
ncbi:MAG: hypothetical protein ACRBF0_02710 [Calditrichia bacterium]